MNAEERKNYNKIYYESNKSKILNKLSEKTQCLICHRMVRYQNMAKHQQTFICSRNADLTKQSTLQRLEQELSKLKQSLQPK